MTSGKWEGVGGGGRGWEGVGEVGGFTMFRGVCVGGGRSERVDDMVFTSQTVGAGRAVNSQLTG